MQMMHSLAGVGAAVGYHPVALGKALLGSHLGDNLENMSHHSTVFGCDFGYGADVDFGDHQNVGGCLGGDIPEGQNGLVFLVFGGGDDPGYNFAKQTIFHIHSPLQTDKTEYTVAQQCHDNACHHHAQRDGHRGGFDAHLQKTGGQCACPGSGARQGDAHKEHQRDK